MVCLRGWKKTYGYPNYSNTKADYESGNIPVNDNFVIREDVYNALGKPDVSTPEKFLKKSHATD